LNPTRKTILRTRPVFSTQITALLLGAALFSGCQSSAPGPGSLTVKASQRALPVMERIAIAASRCWFKTGDKRFRPYRMAPELNSFSGRPRILLVPRNRPQDRPLAVIEGQGDPATIQAYGPLLSAPVGNRIATDIKSWTGGSTACGAST
jgi:hypothetical protein